MTDIIIDTDVTLFEVGRRLKYLSQRKEKKESQKVKKNKPSTGTVKGKEGKGQMDKGLSHTNVFKRNTYV